MLEILCHIVSRAQYGFHWWYDTHPTYSKVSFLPHSLQHIQRHLLNCSGGASFKFSKNLWRGWMKHFIFNETPEKIYRCQIWGTRWPCSRPTSDYSATWETRYRGTLERPLGKGTPSCWSEWVVGDHPVLSVGWGSFPAYQDKRARLWVSLKKKKKGP